MLKFEQIKAENHFIELMTATVSHDMRTPLNSIISLIDSVKPFVQEPR
jgi:signal transduction histidine kinase